MVRCQRTRKTGKFAIDDLTIDLPLEQQLWSHVESVCAPLSTFLCLSKSTRKKLPVYFAPNQTSSAIMDCLSTCIFTLTPLLITYPFDFMWMFDSTRRKLPRHVAPISLYRHEREHSSCETKMSSWMRVINNEPLQSASYSWWWHFSPLPLFFLILVRVSSQFAPLNKLWYSLSLLVL